MKRTLSLLLLVAALCSLHSTTARAQSGVDIDETNFPDEAFRNYVLENIDKDGDGKLSSGEISAVTTLNFSGGGK